MNSSISDQMLLELKEAVDKGDQGAKLYWDNIISSERKKKIEGLIKNLDDLPVRKATPMQRNIYSWTFSLMGSNLQKEMDVRINKVGLEQLKKLDEKSLKIEKEVNENKKGSILFSHQRDQGLIYWCPNKVLNRKVDLPMGKSWPENAELLDTFDF